MANPEVAKTRGDRLALSFSIGIPIG